MHGGNKTAKIVLVLLDISIKESPAKAGGFVIDEGSGRKALAENINGFPIAGENIILALLVAPLQENAGKYGWTAESRRSLYLCGSHCAPAPA